MKTLEINSFYLKQRIFSDIYLVPDTRKSHGQPNTNHFSASQLKKMQSFPLLLETFISVITISPKLTQLYHSLWSGRFNQENFDFVQYKGEDSSKFCRIYWQFFLQVFRWRIKEIDDPSRLCNGGSLIWTVHCDLKLWHEPDSAVCEH